MAADAQLFTPLKSWQTRILRLHPGSCDDVLEADLHVAGLIQDGGLALDWQDDDPVKYEAISYTWGIATTTETVLLNGLRRSISYSLASALYHFRHVDRDRWLWADQICINQADNAEKSRQVRIMINIYEKAERVLAWLGTCSPEMNSTLSRTLANLQINDSERPLRNTIEEPVGSDKANYEVLVELFHRAWPLRAWVQQEVLAARDLHIFCGNCQFTLQQYSSLLLLLQQRPQANVETSTRLVQAVAQLNACSGNATSVHLAKAYMQRCGGWLTGRGDWSSADTRRDRQVLQASRLENVLSQRTTFEATDARDRIYALLGFSCHPVTTMSASLIPHGAYDLMIDYSRSEAQVYQDVTRSLLNRDRHLGVLRLLRGPEGAISRTYNESVSRPQASSTHQRQSSATIRNPNLPSWVIDWQDGNHEWRLYLINYVIKIRGGSRDRPLAWQAADNDRVLRLHGLRLGYVVAVNDYPAFVVDSETKVQPRIEVATHLRWVAKTRARVPLALKDRYGGLYWEQKLQLRRLWSPHRPNGLMKGDIIAQVEGIDQPVALREQGTRRYIWCGAVMASMVDPSYDALAQYSAWPEGDRVVSAYLPDMYPDLVEEFDVV